MEQTYSVEYAGREVAPVFGICFFAGFALLGIAMLIIAIWLYSKIFSKTGYSWAMSLLLLVPFGNLILLLILAFGQWPIQKELELLRRNQSGQGQGAPVPLIPAP